MTDTVDIDVDLLGVTLEELELLPPSEVMATGMTQYNTKSSEAAYEIIIEAALHGDRIEIHGHDSASGLMMPFFSNEGHGRGISADYFLDEIWTNRDTSLSDVLREYPPSFVESELGEIDFFTIIEYK